MLNLLIEKRAMLVRREGGNVNYLGVEGYKCKWANYEKGGIVIYV